MTRRSPLPILAPLWVGMPDRRAVLKMGDEGVLGSSLLALIPDGRRWPGGAVMAREGRRYEVGSLGGERPAMCINIEAQKISGTPCRTDLGKGQPVIQAFDLWKQYDTSDQPDSAALRGANLDISGGEIIALYGKSGSGKTTLLNIMAGLDRPTRGRISIQGRDLESLGEQGKTDLRRQRLGFVFQFFNLLPTLTSFENVFLALELAGRHDPELAIRALELVDLKGKGSRYPHELSGGEQQRVAIARAMVKEPAIILADEPTGNLDMRTGEQILALLTGRCREMGTTLIMATHSPLTCRFSDRVLRMVDGILVEGDDRQEIQV